MSGPMTPTAKHRETAEALIASRIDSMCMTWDHSFGLMDEQQREGLRRNFRQIAYHDLTPFVAVALAKAEREGMKRAAEIALARTHRSIEEMAPVGGDAYCQGSASSAECIRNSILSEVGED